MYVYNIVITMLCMVVPKGISLKVDFTFLSIKTPSQTIQTSSKTYGFLDIDDDLYTDGSFIYRIIFIYVIYEVPNFNCLFRR